MFVATGIGPYSGQAVHFQRAAPDQIAYAINCYRREAERGRATIVGDDYTIVDMAAWGWIDRAVVVLPGGANPVAPFPNLMRWLQTINARPAVARARNIGADHSFKQEMDEEARRALFPSNYPDAA